MKDLNTASFNMIKILIADDSPEFGLKYASVLRRLGFDVKLTRKNGRILLKEIENEHPDAVIMDASMAEIDAIEVLICVSKSNIQRPKMIVTSVFDTPFLEKSVLENGADLYVIKPFEIEVLAQRISAMVGKANAKAAFSGETEFNLERTVTDILRSLGIPANINGYRFIRDAVMICVADKGKLDGVTKVLYPEVAKLNNSTPSRVERGIRHAIEHAHKRGKIGCTDSICGFAMDFTTKKPTNSQFLALIVDSLVVSFGIR